MSKIQSSKRIQEVVTYGVAGYKVEFSVRDLYALEAMARMVWDRHPEDSVEKALAETIRDLFLATIGGPSTQWDFLKKEESAE